MLSPFHSDQRSKLSLESCFGTRFSFDLNYSIHVARGKCRFEDCHPTCSVLHHTASLTLDVGLVSSNDRSICDA